MGRRLTFLCDDEGRFRLLSNEGGAVHEAYSDIIGTAVEFSVHAPGAGPLRADYVMGEDTGRTVRSLEDPRAIAVTLYRGVFRYPDAMGRDVRFIAVSDGQTIHDFGVCVVEGQVLLALGCDNGGVHWNSTILSHAFYLAIEGGQNRATGRDRPGGGGRQSSRRRTRLLSGDDPSDASPNDLPTDRGCDPPIGGRPVRHRQRDPPGGRSGTVRGWLVGDPAHRP